MKTNEQTRPITDANQLNDRVITNVSTYGELTVSETEKGILSRMDRNTPGNELILRGFC